MSASAVSPKEFGRRFRKALSVPFLLKNVCSSNVQEFVTEYSAALGCSEKSIFFPLLSTVSTCLGIESKIELTKLWSEPPIVWTLVITPISLSRVDVIEHIKHQLLKAQDEVWKLEEDSKDHMKKFVFDNIPVAALKDVLRLSNGHGMALYNSTRSLNSSMQTIDDADALQRLHSGLSWFTDSRNIRTTMAKTHVNFSILSTPAHVQQSLYAGPNFGEFLHQVCLTTCSEEAHVKFGQLISADHLPERLKLIFTSLLKMHISKDPIVYKLSEEAQEKFREIHDELTDKAKQMARKNAHKVYQPAVAYLARISCALHVLDNAVYAATYGIPIDRQTWSTEISADEVWHARELLGHVIEQRHALMEPTMIEPGPRSLPNTQNFQNSSTINRGTPTTRTQAMQPRFGYNGRRNTLGNHQQPINVTPIIESVSSLSSGQEMMLR